MPDSAVEKVVDEYVASSKKRREGVDLYYRNACMVHGIPYEPTSAPTESIRKKKVTMIGGSTPEPQQPAAVEPPKEPDIKQPKQLPPARPLISNGAMAALLAAAIGGPLAVGGTILGVQYFSGDKETKPAPIEDDGQALLRDLQNRGFHLRPNDE